MNKADIDRLESQLETDIKAHAAAVAARHKAEDICKKAERKVFETRKALIRTINEVNSK